MRLIDAFPFTALRRAFPRRVIERRAAAGLIASVLGFMSPVPAAAADSVAKQPVPKEVKFNRDVRPIMSNTCFKCHGPDVKNNESELRLDLPEAALAPRKDETGRTFTPLVPGRPRESEVWRRINSSDDTVVMPPPDTLHQLSARDKAVIERWIAQGAKYEPHWAYVPHVKVSPPAVPAGAAAHNKIDHFILAALDTRGLEPSPEADRATLLRRLSLDVAGLPPTPQEVEAFVTDASPDAYERAVDRLLASPHYGERMASPWLDLARFADSVGFHGDQRQNIFPYRDYVIDAFNDNKPFDQFTREQLAGDLLPEPTVDQRVATGFNRLNMMTREGGAQPKEYLAKYAADRVRTVSTTWLGSTVGCAECHDHKFDPFKTRDFYSLAAYFADVKQWGVYSDYKFTPNPDLKGFNNDYPFPPEIEVESPYLVRRAAGLRRELATRLANAAREILADIDGAAAVDTWAKSVRAQLAPAENGWITLAPVKIVAGGKVTASTLADQSVLFEGEDPKKEEEKKEAPKPATNERDKQAKAGVAKLGKEESEQEKEKEKKKKKELAHTLNLELPPGPLAVIRVEVIPDEKNGGRVGRAGEDRFETKVTFAIEEAEASGKIPCDSLPIAAAFPDCPTETFFNAYRLASVTERWRSSRELGGQRQAAVFILEQPVPIAPGDRLVATFTRGDSSVGDVGRVRLAASPFGLRFPDDEIGRELTAALAAANPTTAQDELLAAEYLQSTAHPATAFAEALRLTREIAECHDGRAYSMVTKSTTPGLTRVLPRGNWQDESGEIVEPSPPGFLLDDDKPAGTSRLDLANWLVSRDNPLTARVFVNRLWQQFFGTGLSGVLDDLGMQGEYPSHPELLDWLAIEFMDRGWDVKAIVRLIVTSATYRQASRVRPELAEIDPQNRLLARQNP
ncbi:MAG: PSD1 and planctomycete cytochrome C domain-containing protein, partial [Opitutaceae bacterium]